MAVTSRMTYKIGLIWRHMKPSIRYTRITLKSSLECFLFSCHEHYKWWVPIVVIQFALLTLLTLVHTTIKYNVWGSPHESTDPDQCGPSVDSQNQDCVYPINRRSRFAYVLHITFEDVTLTQCDFSSVLKRDAIRAHSLLAHTCTYTLIVVFISTAHAAIYAVLKILLKPRYDLALARPLGIRIDLDPRSRVANPIVIPCHCILFCD